MLRARFSQCEDTEVLTCPCLGGAIPLPPQASDDAAESPGGACGRQYLDACRSSQGAGGLLGGAPAATEQPQRQLLGAFHSAMDLRDEGRHRSSRVFPTSGSDVPPAGGKAPALGPGDVVESAPRARVASRRQLLGRLLGQMRATPAGAMAGSSKATSVTGRSSLADRDRLPAAAHQGLAAGEGGSGLEVRNAASPDDAAAGASRRDTQVGYGPVSRATLIFVVSMPQWQDLAGQHRRGGRAYQRSWLFDLHIRQA